MLLLHIIILALIQGITEFLPISSSGHLLLTHELIGKTDSDLILDVAVHVGTLFAALLYFRSDICSMLCSLKSSKDSKLLICVIIGSLPVIIAGYLIHLSNPEWARSLHLMAWCTLIFGIVLGAADKFSPSEKTLDKITFKDALLIGLSQVLALIPGTSRSGITMSMARILGFKAYECARFSLLLGIIAISGAGTLGAADLIDQGNLSLGLDVLCAGLMAFISGYGAIYLMMRWLEKAGFMPFVWYRIALGLLLLCLLYTGVFDAALIP